MIVERHIVSGRGRMTWLEAGAGWPLVFLHAFPLHAEMWRPQLERVPDGWRFIAPDFRGFGRMESAERAESLDDYAADVDALLQALGIEDAVIAGLSMGGYVAFALYRQAPGRFTSLILADTRSQADTAEGRAGRVRMRELLARDGPRAVADQMLPKLLSEQADPALVRYVRRLIEGASPAAIDAAIAAMMNRPDSTPDLPGIACAALVLAGDRDAITPVADAEAMQGALPRSTLTVVHGAGHLANLERPDAFSRAIADFLLAHL